MVTKRRLPAAEEENVIANVNATKARANSHQKPYCDCAHGDEVEPTLIPLVGHRVGQNPQYAEDQEEAQVEVVRPDLQTV